MFYTGTITATQMAFISIAMDIYTDSYVSEPIKNICLRKRRLIIVIPHRHTHARRL